ncbi:MAG: type IV secretion system DNA-binding domain-containing protein [Planctomycetes bacterium]|nr:type IV secretion system DNA-binding domain-containing protein [Planctomycetota bacterium]
MHDRSGMESNHENIILGRTNWRDRTWPFGLRQRDRLYHVYVVGQTGAGKSTLLQLLMHQDLAAGRGFAFLDPHGDTVSRVAERASKIRGRDLVYLDAPDPSAPVGFNPLEAVPQEQRALAASGIIEAFKNVWGQYWGPKLEHIFRNALLTLLDQPAATLADLPRLFSDQNFQKEAIAHVVHPPVRDFWFNEFFKLPPWSKAEALGPIRNKLGAFLSQPTLYRILTKPKSDFDLRKMMDEGKVLLVNLSKGRMGADASSLLGALLVTRVSLAALSRADSPEENRRPFFLYLDEFQNVTTLSVATMLSELRKYRVGLTLAHQYLGQLETEVRDAILGNVGTIIAFRIGPADVSLLGKYFEPEFDGYDLLNLPNRCIYVRLMVNGSTTRPFSADTISVR